MIQNNTFANFKPYSFYVQKTSKNNIAQNDSAKKNLPKNIQVKPFIGSAIGIISGLLISYFAFKNYMPKDSIKTFNELAKKSNKTNLSPLETDTFNKLKSKNDVKEITTMLTMATLADIGAVVGGSIGKPKEQKKKKIHEAMFQIMNTALPMFMVTGGIKLAEKIKFLNNTPGKMLGSIAGMVAGAALATGINNATKDKHAPVRKYGPKDLLADVDDIAATIVIGFPNLGWLTKAAQKSLPLIYGYCGYRAGTKE